MKSPDVSSRWLIEWPLWLGIACLSIVAAPFVLRGWSAWRDEAAVRAVVVGFFQAVIDGRQDVAQSLQAENNVSFSSDEAQSLFEGNESQDGVLIRVSNIDIAAAEAQARVVISKQGFRLTPTVSLVRDPLGPWRIARVDDVAIDPKWSRLQDSKLRETDEALAEELKTKLRLADAPESAQTR